MRYGLAFLISTLVACLVFAQASKRLQPVRIMPLLTKPDAAGRQILTVKLAIEPGWHIYAHEVGAAGPVPTTVEVSSAVPLKEKQIQYPPGKAKIQAGETFQIYEGSVEITVRLQRSLVNGQPDTSPLTVSVRYQACNDQICLPPRTEKLTVQP